MATKKNSPKKTKETKTKEVKVKKQIEGKAIGRNIILVIDGEKFTRSIAEKEKRDALLELVASYNTNNSIKKEKEILNVMLEKDVAKKEKEAKKEEIKEKVEKITKSRTNVKDKVVPAMTIEEAKKLLEKDGYTVTKQQVKPQTTRNREH